LDLVRAAVFWQESSSHPETIFATRMLATVGQREFDDDVANLATAQTPFWSDTTHRALGMA